MKVNPDLETFRLWFPEFTQTEDSKVERFLGDALEIHGVNPRCTLYVAAHLAALDSLEGSEPDLGLGELQEEQEGPLRARMKVQARNNREVFFTTTKYGRTFLEFEKRTPQYTFSGGFF